MAITTGFGLADPMVRRDSKHPSFFGRTPYDNADWYDEELLQRARDYVRPLKRLRIASTAVGLVIAVLTVLLLVGPRVEAALPRLPWPAQVLAILLVLAIIDMPFSLAKSCWTTLVYHRRWGFSTQTLRGWLADQAKELALGLTLGTALLSLLLELIRLTPYWWLVATAVSGGLVLIVGFIFPVVIMPVFNKQKPMEGELLERIQRIARLAGVPVSGAYVMDASRRSTRDNAVATGFGKTRRVIVFDTMLNHPGYVLDHVIAHELGHNRRRHNFVSVPLAMATVGLQFVLVALLASIPSVRHLAGITSLADPAALPLILLLMAICSPVISLVTAWASRVLERQADLEALELLGDPGAFIDSWKRMMTKNLGDFEPSWYSRATHDHPETAERMAFIKKWAEANDVPIVEPTDTRSLASVVSPEEPAPA
ncbi:MAG: M48 family metalloprotease [Candidatus Dormibacteria bacterium]